MPPTTAISEIKQRIAEGRLKRADNLAIIATKQRNNEIIDAELATWEAALDLVLKDANAAATSDFSGNDSSRVHVSGDLAATQVDLGLGQLDQRRGPRGFWKTIMPEMAKRYPANEFDLNKLNAVAQFIGIPLNSSTARSQMHNYAKSGLLDRVRSGWFKFTNEGLKTFGGLSRLPDNAASDPETKTPAVDDVQAAGASRDDVSSVIPQASSVWQHTDGEGDPR